MNIRKVWILSAKDSKLLLSHQFLLNEVKSDCGPLCQLFDDKTMLSAYLRYTCWSSDNTIQFSAIRDACDRSTWSPTLALQVLDSEVWPLVTVTGAVYIYLVLPAVPLTSRHHPFSELPEICAALEFIEALGLFLDTNPHHDTTHHDTFLEDVENIINYIAPYGTLAESSVSNYQLAMSKDYNLSISQTDVLYPLKNPANTVHILLKELVTGDIYNRRRVQDSIKYQGTLQVEASLPPNTDLSFTLLTTRDLLQVLTNPALRDFTDTSADNQLQIFVTPTRDLTPLLDYSFEQISPPVSGVYELRKGEVAFSLSFKLALTIYPEHKLAITGLEVRLPLPNRGPILSTVYQPSDTNVFLNKKKNKLIWLHSLPIKPGRLSLEGTVVFDPAKQAMDGTPFLKDYNAFADLRLKSSGVTLSKMRVESVTVFPTVRVKTDTVIHTHTRLRVWNTFGDTLQM